MEQQNNKCTNFQWGVSSGTICQTDLDTFAKEVAPQFIVSMLPWFLLFAFAAMVIKGILESVADIFYELANSAKYKYKKYLKQKANNK